MDNPDKLKLHKKKQDYPYTPSESSNKDKLSKKEKEEDKNIQKEITTDETQYIKNLILHFKFRNFFGIINYYL